MAWVFLSGCQQARPIASPAPVRIDAGEYDAAFDAAVAVLQRHGFALDRVDYRFGTVTSQPRSASTIAEPFRPTNSSFAQAWESTLNDRRRVVTFLLEPVEKELPKPTDAAAANEANSLAIEGEAASDDASPAALPVGPATTGERIDRSLTEPQREYLLRVEVMIERLQAPRRQLTGSTVRLFHQLDRTPAELVDRNIDGNYYRPMYRDALLERSLLAEVMETVRKQPNPSR